MAQDNKVIFCTDDGEEVEFAVIEQTKINGTQYLLVTDANDNEEEAEAYILKDISKDEDAEAIYDIVEDDNELDAIGKVFTELLDDIDLK